MRKILWLAVLLFAAAAVAQQLVDQGAPGTQGAWPVTLTGGSVIITLGDAGLTINTNTQPCTRIVMTNDAGYSTTPQRVPASGPTAGRIWIRICNTILNSSGTVCTCATDSCPSSVAASVQGDVLATADCATYSLGVADGGLPCCVCNGSGIFLPAAECIP
jgi:hypothetical protein